MTHPPLQEGGVGVPGAGVGTGGEPPPPQHINPCSFTGTDLSCCAGGHQAFHVPLHLPVAPPPGGIGGGGDEPPPPIQQAPPSLWKGPTLVRPLEGSHHPLGSGADPAGQAKCSITLFLVFIFLFIC